MSGLLYLVATPIGNFEDMTLRAVRILKEADLIACEDTRTSRVLLDHFGIETPVTSYHKFNEQEKSGELLKKLSEGKNIAVITDAGMPAISDPGEILVRKCHESGIAVVPIPGASASVTALAASGLDTRRFVFEGFLPQETKEKNERMELLRDEMRTMIFYEAPHRLKKTLKTMEETFGADRKITVARELTKKFEEIRVTTLGEEVSDTREPRGEYVLVVAGCDPKDLDRRRAAEFESLTMEEHLALYESKGLDRKSAMRAVARDRGISRRDVYNELLKNQGGNV